MHWSSALTPHTNNTIILIIEGYGKIVDPHTVQVTMPDGTARTLTTKNILIAVGGKANKLNIPGAVRSLRALIIDDDQLPTVHITQEHAMISDDALVLDTFPSKGVAIIGAGYIAVEFAGIFRGFGAEVHLVYRGEQPLRGFDGDVRTAVVENLKARGMNLHPHSHPVRYACVTTQFQSCNS